MKLCFLILLCAFKVAVADSTPNDFAEYIVPTPPELVGYSRFEVGIVKSYSGQSSTEISYIFPKLLTGDPALVVKFQRTGTESGPTTHWDSDVMEAVCTDNGKRISCNIYLKKAPEFATKTAFGFTQAQFLTPLLNSSGAIDFINKSGLSPEAQAAQLAVLDKFMSSEPGGILSYDYN